jgi:hypothetical protein
MRTPRQHLVHPPLRGLCAVALCTLSLLIACSPDAPLATSVDDAATSADGAAVRPTGPLTISAARMLAVPDGPCVYILPTAINDKGVIVGTTFMCPDQKEGAVQWDAAGNLTWLPEVDGLGLHPFHIGNDGTILATTYQRDVNRTRYFSLQPSGRLAEMMLPDRPGSTFSIYAGPNRTGTMLLSENPGNGMTRYHLWKGAARTTLIPTAPRGEFRPSGLNDLGEVTGHIHTGDNAMQAVSWSRQHGFRVLTLPEGAQYGIGGEIDNAGTVFGSTEWPLPASCTGFFGASAGRVTLWGPTGTPRLVGDGVDFLCSSGPDFRDVNTAGTAVGALSYRSALPSNNAFVVTADGRSGIAPCELDGVRATEGCHAVAINRHGTVIGVFIDAPVGIQAVTWTVAGN